MKQASIDILQCFKKLSVLVYRKLVNMISYEKCGCTCLCQSVHIYIIRSFSYFIEE